MPESDPITEALSARLVRAAVAYSGLENKDVAQRAGIKPDTFRNYVSAARPTRLALEKRYAVAEACGVPRAFMEYGFARPAATDDELRATVRRLEVRVGQLQAELEVLAVEARRRNAEDAQTTKGPQRRRPA